VQEKKHQWGKKARPKKIRRGATPLSRREKKTEREKGIASHGVIESPRRRTWTLVKLPLGLFRGWEGGKQTGSTKHKIRGMFRYSIVQ